MKLEIIDSIAHLTFTEAARGNPIDGIFCADLRTASIALSQGPHIRAVLITAEGRSFSVGGDIAAFSADLEALPRNIALWAGDLHDAIARMQRIDAPIVAAIHGPCAGGMVALMAGADVVVASSAAKFVSAYTGIGYSCDAGASIMLSRRMGKARACRFLILGETLDPQGALAAGLVDEVVSAADLGSRALEIAQRFAAGPTCSFGEIKRLFLTVGQQPLEAQLALEAMAITRTAATVDAKAALVAFREKRRPVFYGH